MIKYIDVYSLPRSGSNLFAAYMMQHPKIVSYNVGGGRHPFFASKRRQKYEIYTGPGIFKNLNQELILLRDELKFNYIGPRYTWPEQLLHKFTKALLPDRSVNIILLRNPYAIASSMYSYQMRNESHKHVWDVARNEICYKFVVQFKDLLKKIPSVISNRGLLVEPYSFFNKTSLQKTVFDTLALDIEEMNDVTRCRKGHTFVKEGSIYRCPCGELKGYGGYVPLSNIDPSRLLTSQAFLQTGIQFKLRNLLKREIGDRLTSFFTEDGMTDVCGLMSELLSGVSPSEYA